MAYLYHTTKDTGYSGKALSFPKNTTLRSNVSPFATEIIESVKVGIFQEYKLPNSAAWASADNKTGEFSVRASDVASGAA
jgi:hypothetical protein